MTSALSRILRLLLPDFRLPIQETLAGFWQLGVLLYGSLDDANPLAVPESLLHRATRVAHDGRGCWKSASSQIRVEKGREHARPPLSVQSRENQPQNEESSHPPRCRLSTHPRVGSSGSLSLQVRIVQGPQPATQQIPQPPRTLRCFRLGHNDEAAV